MIHGHQTIYLVLVALAALELITSSTDRASTDPLPPIAAGLTLAASLSVLLLSLYAHGNLPKEKRASVLLLVLPVWAAGRIVALVSSTEAFGWTLSTISQALFIVFIVLAVLAESIRKTPWNPSLNPASQAHIYSQLTFEWLSPLLRLGRQRTLVLDDLPPLRARDTSAAISAQFAVEWKKQLASPRPSLWRLYISLFAPEFILSGLLKLSQDLLGFAQPLLLSRLISFASSHSTSTPQPLSHGLLTASLMLLASLSQTSLLQSYFFRVMSTALRAEAGTITLLFSKSLTSANPPPSGELLNLQSVDADRIGDSIPYFHILWSGPLQIAVALGLLYLQLGPSTLVGVFVILLLIPVNALLAKLDASLESTLMNRRDDRGKRTGELWRAIGVVRMYGWQSPFTTLISGIRRIELRTLSKLGILSSIGSLFWTCSPFFVSLATFASFSYFSTEPLTAQRIFVSLSLFNLITWPLIVFPMVVNDLIQALISARRIREFLVAPDLEAAAVRREPEGDPAIHADARFGYPEGPVVKVGLEVGRGELVGVTGRVGEGKSTLLAALLGEVPKLDPAGWAVLRSGESVGYFPQQPYIRSGTIRENILFNLPLDTPRYEAVLDACALRADLAAFPAGDSTEIGARGVNLSGGQKARLALARAAYSTAGVLLLDDPLAAVDARVSRYIWENCIGPRGLMKGRTRVVVGHGKWIGACDRVLAMRGGDIVEVEKGEMGVVDGGEGMEEEEAQKAEEKGEGGVLVEPEESRKGSVGWATYAAYIRACGVFGVSIYLLLSVAAQVMGVARNLWLAHWAAQNETEEGAPVYTNLLIYAGLGMAQTIFVALHQLVAKVWCAIRASRVLHDGMLERVVRAPQWWFDATPLGRILNRFTSDINTVDQKLIRDLSGWVGDLLMVASVVVVDSAATPALLFFIIPLGAVYYAVGSYYVASSRELQRLQSVTKSPVYQHFSETLGGLPTIRAFAQQENFSAEAKKKLDDNLRARFARFSANRWLAVRLEGIGSLILFGTALFSVLAIANGKPIDAPIVGLVISYALSLGDSLSWLVRESCEVEASIVAVERIQEYNQVPQEAPLFVDAKRPRDGWPEKGSVTWENYSTRYRPHLPMVLQNVNLSIRGGEKIGLCGRTGSGKSTLALSLFRIVEPTAGRILVDGIDVTDNFGLADLRSSITVIPQDAVLFVGTIRTNLDPFSQHPDPEIWRALELAHLKPLIVSLESGLESPVSENGSNFSSGQKQLLCLARALLRQTRILILDEASANLDLTSDALVQSTIREAFREATVITIAHRLDTILEYDRIAVLADGQVLECDKPGVLLEDRSSSFYGLAREAGIVGK